MINIGIIRYLMKECENQGIYPYLPMGFIDEVTGEIYENIKLVIQKIWNFNDYDCMYFFDIEYPEGDRENNKIEIRLIKNKKGGKINGSFSAKEKPIIRIYINQFWTIGYVTREEEEIKRWINEILIHEITHYKQWIYAIGTDPNYRFKGNRKKIRTNRNITEQEYKRYKNEQREVEAKCTEIISIIESNLRVFFDNNGDNIKRYWEENGIERNKRIEYIYNKMIELIRKKLVAFHERQRKYIEKKIVYTISGYIERLG